MNQLLTELHALIGREVDYAGVYCQVIDVLSDGPSLVLGRLRDEGVIQPDQYGDAKRRVPKTYTVPLISEIDHDLHPVVRALAEPEQLEVLRALLSEHPG